VFFVRCKSSRCEDWRAESAQPSYGNRLSFVAPAGRGRFVGSATNTTFIRASHALTLKRQLLATDLRKILAQLRFLAQSQITSGYASSLGSSLALKLLRISATINCRFKV
jgi:hypothetical protein